jgi:hypothetical protein
MKLVSRCSSSFHSSFDYVGSRWEKNREDERKFSKTPRWKPLSLQLVESLNVAAEEELVKNEKQPDCNAALVHSACGSRSSCGSTKVLHAVLNSRILTLTSPLRPTNPNPNLDRITGPYESEKCPFVESFRTHAVQLSAAGCW